MSSTSQTETPWWWRHPGDPYPYGVMCTDECQGCDYRKRYWIGRGWTLYYLLSGGPRHQKTTQHTMVRRIESQRYG